jgi:hypothetical protein
MAIWLVAWLAGQLAWKPTGQPVKSTGDSDSILAATFAGPAGNVAVDIVTRPAPAGTPATPRLAAFVITTRTPEGTELFRLCRPDPASSAVHVEVEAPGSCLLPRVVEAAELDPARRIAAALESSRLDPPFQKALPMALWLMEFQRS